MHARPGARLRRLETGPPGTNRDVLNRIRVGGGDAWQVTAARAAPTLRRVRYRWRTRQTRSIEFLVKSHRASLLVRRNSTASGGSAALSPHGIPDRDGSIPFRKVPRTTFRLGIVGPGLSGFTCSSSAGMSALHLIAMATVTGERPGVKDPHGKSSPSRAVPSRLTVLFESPVRWY